MGKEFEYYRVDSTNNDKFPLLKSDKGNPRYLYQDEPITDPDLMLFKWGTPVPRKPEMTDYHSSPESIISKKIYDVLNPLHIHGIQLLPARIRGTNEEIFTDYWAIHIYNNISCVDPKLSDCAIEDSGLGFVNKLVLDKAILKEIPLHERLIFRLKEDFAYQLFHVSIVEKIMDVKPGGIRFVNIEEWN